MTRQSVAGIALMAVGLSVGTAVVFLVKMPPDHWVTLAFFLAPSIVPVVLGALLFDYEELGPLADKVLGRWRNGG